MPWYAARKHYLVRVHVINHLTNDDEWYTIAFIPYNPSEKASCGAERFRPRRIAVLQRML